MPRDKQTNEFVAGALQTITHEGKKYFVDGRLEECRSVEEHWVKLDVDEEEIFYALSQEDQDKIVFEYYGN